MEQITEKNPIKINVRFLEFNIYHIYVTFTFDFHKLEDNIFLLVQSNDNHINPNN